MPAQQLKDENSARLGKKCVSGKAVFDYANSVSTYV
jgi:hypothetical protein